MATADQLLDQMFSLIEQKELCVENLTTLAHKLESSRSLLDSFNSNTMKEMQDTKEESNRIREEIQKLFEQLKTESSSTDPDKVDRHIMAEVLKAMARRSKVEGQITIHMHNDRSLVINSVHLKPELLDGLKQLIEQMSKTGLLKGEYKFVGGAIGLVSKFHEIDNWTDLIENNRVTKASQLLRDTADTTLESCQTLREQFDNIRKIIEEVDKSQREHEENKSSNPARDQSGNQQTSVEAQTDQRHEDEQEGGTGSDQQGGGDQGDKETDRDDKDWDYERSEDQYNIIIYIISKLHFQNMQRPPGAIKVALLNVRSMNKKRRPEKILKLITKNNLDVLLTTETWLQEDNADRVLSKSAPPDYHHYYQVREGQRGRRGSDSVLTAAEE
ncbi:uncharacterized protein LOC127360053 isoform X2 [Dicentrarchus labrax]|nr:uncharacterized protein LOC127360053 isoform X2 [Dicentrarchus labrax]